MGRSKFPISIILVAVFVLGSSLIVSAQWSNQRRVSNDGAYRNIDHNFLNNEIKDLKRRSGDFKKVLDRALDNSRYDGTVREDDINRLAEIFKDAADDLDDTYDNEGDYNRSRDEAQSVISAGLRLDQALANSRARGNTTLQGDWNNIEGNLISVSQAFRLDYRGGNFRTARGSFGNNNRNNRFGNRNGRDNRNLQATIKNLRSSSKQLKEQIKRERKNSRYGNFRELEQLSDRFDDAVRDLDREYDNNGDYGDSQNEIQRVLNTAEALNRAISYSQASYGIRSDWSRIERDIETISRQLNDGNSGRRGNSRRTGNFNGNFPF